MPELETEMKQYPLNSYNDDPPKLWAFETLKHLPFLQDLEKDLEWPLLHSIYFQMNRRMIPKGDLLFRPG